MPSRGRTLRRRAGPGAGRDLPVPARPAPTAWGRLGELQRAAGSRAVHHAIQAKLAAGPTGDRYEREADELAARVPQPAPGLDSREPAAGGPDGTALDPETRAVMERHLGHDLGAVRIHAGPRAAEAASSVKARAYTVGSHVVFGHGGFAPGTPEGQRLLAHELAHVVQQATGSHAGAAPPALQRSPDDQRPGRTGELRATNFKAVTMEFDGADLVVLGDGREVLRFSAQSGRPVRLDEKDASQGGANPATDTYMNDKRFVGVKDFGPIPEGSYNLSPPAIEQFTSAEQRSLTFGGIVGRPETVIKGRPIHSGDWGSGRVALSPRGRLREGPVGSVRSRSGFFLHGGVLAGSSGCIDIGGGFDRVADFLEGYRRPIVVTVRYTQPPPSVRFFTGLSGAIAYSRFQLGHGPGLGLGAEFSQAGARPLASASYNAILQWAGGALTAGARLDLPLTDKGAFLRAGLSGGVDFRLLGPLYGRLFGGYSRELSGESRAGGPEVGAGLRLDLNRVQLEAIYNVLRPASEDQQVRQALLQIGFRL